MKTSIEHSNKYFKGPVAEQIRPRPHQKEAVDAALKYFSTNDRGQLIQPCGTGKTLTALWIAEAMQRPEFLILYQVPSLALIAQTLKEWRENTLFEPFDYLCLCSDKSVDYDYDDIDYKELEEQGVKVTTNPYFVANFLREKHKTKILFSTYQSSEALTSAMKLARVKFDVAFYDEAHKTANSKYTAWNLSLDNYNVPVEKRIFMTATPRIYAPHLKAKAEYRDDPLFSMDDELIYGKPFFNMTFGDAIKDNLICDYEILIIAVTSQEVKDVISSDAQVDPNTFAKQLALKKAMEQYSVKKIFTFHNTIAKAKGFIQAPSTHPVFSGIDTFHINAKMPSNIRTDMMRKFANRDKAIMSNAKCLTEGVDAPIVDCVAFIDPKKSLIEIVQATGRALRKHVNKAKGYILIPIIIDENTPIEAAIEESQFQTVFYTIQAMSEQDETLKQTMTQLRQSRAENEHLNSEYFSAWRLLKDKIKVINLPMMLGENIAKNIYLKSVDVTTSVWEFWYGLTLKYARRNGGNPNASTKKTFENYPLGVWQSAQRSAYNKGILTKNRVELLSAIPFWSWNLFDSNMQELFDRTIEYAKSNNNNPNAPATYITNDGYRLGARHAGCRARYRNGKLSQAYIDMYKQIPNWSWNLVDTILESLIKHTLEYMKEFNTPNAPQKYVSKDGYKLGGAQKSVRTSYKRGELPVNKIKSLESIPGWEWRLAQSKDEVLEEGIKHSIEYAVFNNGDPNAPRGVNFKGFNLGEWQRNQRLQYKKAGLSQDRIERLEKIGFKWTMK